MSTVPDMQKFDADELQAPIARPPTNSAGAARLGLWVLGLGLGGFLLWAGFAPLDEGVPTHGMVTIDTKSRAVQHLSGGMVRAVRVREGELVKQDQILIELDEGVAKANHEAVRQRYLGFRAVQGRLLAEQSGQPNIAFHPDLLGAKGDPLIAAQMVTQQDLLRSRRAALAAELGAVDENIRGLASTVEMYGSIMQSRKTQLQLLEQELGQTRPLVAEGYVPRNRLLELERSQADLQAALFDLNGQTMRARQSIAELTQRKLARQQDYRKEVETQMADVSREVESDAQKMVAVADDLSRTLIKSPADGQVMGLAVHAAGAVVQPAQKLMMVVPAGAPLVLETRIEPHLIDNVRPGLVTDVRFSSFSHSPQLVVEGRVDSVSQDLIVDQATGVGYYLARVGITENGMRSLGKRQMQPGMPADVIVKTGERSLLTYLLNPLMKRVAASLKEE